MDWSEAKKQIEKKIHVGTEVNSKKSKQVRKILETERPCNRYDYNGEKGFLVSIGKKEDLEIPWSMLENCFPELRKSKGYNTHCFRKKYKRQFANKDCHVHVVSAIFEKSGIAYEKDNAYFILDEKEELMS